MFALKKIEIYAGKDPLDFNDQLDKVLEHLDGSGYLPNFECSFDGSTYRSTITVLEPAARFLAEKFPDIYRDSVTLATDVELPFRRIF